MKYAFCERNLRPIFVLLVVLIVATIVWAIVAGRGGRAAAEQEPLPPTPNRTARRTPGTGQGRGISFIQVDAVSIATPNGGIRLIAQPAGAPWRPRWRPPSVGFGAPGGPLGAALPPARMQLVAGDLRSRHAFNTVSSLILPSVVSIHATRRRLAGRPIGAGGEDRFADPFAGVPERHMRNGAYGGVGSGLIIDSRGYVLTNYHVISQAADLLVSVFGKIKRDFHAAVIAVDPAADLALIGLSGAPALPEARLGSSRSVQAGDWVLAFGSPFGLEQTVTQGIISNKRKSLVIGGVAYGEMLQTDAPINRGSSGGPLVNLKAEVIGINTAIYGPYGVFSGTGFAIPVDRANAFLVRCGHVLDRGRG